MTKLALIFACCLAACAVDTKDVDQGSGSDEGIDAGMPDGNAPSMDGSGSDGSGSNGSDAGPPCGIGRPGHACCDIRTPTEGCLDGQACFTMGYGEAYQGVCDTVGTSEIDGYCSTTMDSVPTLSGGCAAGYACLDTASGAQQCYPNCLDFVNSSDCPAEAPICTPYGTNLQYGFCAPH